MVNALPNMPQPIAGSSSNGIKIADPDVIILGDEPIPVETMTDLIFENIGGQEILNIARHDLVNGQNVSYSPIKNLSQVYLKYNPKNIVGLQDTSDSIFNSFPIKLAAHIPSVGLGPDGSYVYVDELDGSIVVNATNLKADYQIEIQIASSMSTLDDTIYVEGAS